MLCHRTGSFSEVGRAKNKLPDSRHQKHRKCFFKRPLSSRLTPGPRSSILWRLPENLNFCFCFCRRLAPTRQPWTVKGDMDYTRHCEIDPPRANSNFKNQHPSPLRSMLSRRHEERAEKPTPAITSTLNGGGKGGLVVFEIRVCTGLFDTMSKTHLP